MNAFLTGYIATDLNGDGIADGTDIAIVDNSLNIYVSVVSPEGLPGKVSVRQVKTKIGNQEKGIIKKNNNRTEKK